MEDIKKAIEREARHSLMKKAGVDRMRLPNYCVTRDYNLFRQ